ncbi:MAG: peptidylprolyl isomerase [Bacteroidales bacterium]|nr:peptidylprolyl isomerase [Bacteroidales bacterium]
MKRSLFAFALLLSVLGAALAKDPVLMKINNHEVTKSEFEYIYGKNNTSSSIDKKSLDEYLVLFKNFKLKVIEAESLGIDTTKAFKTELDGYRKQLTQPYLTDKTVEDRLAHEAYDRMKENIELSHILLMVKEDASPADTLTVYNKLMDIRKRLFTQAPAKKGGKPVITTSCSKDVFDKMASEVSEDPSKAENKGYLGFISSGMTVYPFEMAAFNAKIGEVSMPIRTNYGYHLIMVHGRRPDQGQVLVAHIMKTLRPKADSISPEKAEKDAKRDIEEVYAKLKAGGDFGELAMKESDDRGSAPKKGELPWFGVNRMIKEFETVAFGFKTPGEYSEPFKTRFGWHIAKLIEKKGLEPFEEKREEIVKSFARDSRAQAGQLQAIAQFKTMYNFSENKKSLDELAILGKTQAPKDSVFQVIAQTMMQPLFTIGDKTYSQNEFAAYLKNQPVVANHSGEDVVRAKYTDFVNDAVLKYEDSRLESKYPEFKNLMQEYHDGMLLFEISNNEVWEKASKDDAGLKNYFAKNRKKYDWTIPKYKGLVVYCKDEATQKKAQDIIKKTGVDSVAYVLQKSLNDSITRIKVEKVLAAKGENKVLDGKVFKGETYVPTSQFPFVFIKGKLLKNAPEDYTDVRGLVTSDYQNFLEEAWVKKLNEKYKVEVDQDVLKTVKP